jgi:ParB family chromosome partitioning protein
MTHTLISPTAIDAFVSIEAIKVAGRHRKDLGDLRELALSIQDVDLLNPITLTRDGRLVAGQRRLEACRLLGWSQVPVRFVDSLDDAAKLLRAERDENLCRQEMRPSELGSLGAALYEIEAESAKTRQREHGGTAPGRPSHTQGTRTTSDVGEPGSDHNKTRHVVGEALGMSGRTYSELHFAHRAATDTDASEEERELARKALAEMDRTGAIARPARDLRRQLRAKREAQEVKRAVLAEPPVESQPDEPKRPGVERFDRMRELANSGHTSEQIAKTLGYSSAATLRVAAKKQGITIPADEALGVRTRKSIDSNRVVRETAIALDGLAMGVQLVNINDLDPAEIDGWASSITTSIRTLNRLVRQLKEKAS